MLNLPYLSDDSRRLLEKEKAVRKSLRELVTPFVQSYKKDKKEPPNHTNTVSLNSDKTHGYLSKFPASAAVILGALISVVS